MTQNENLALTNDPPSNLLSTYRIADDQSPWIIRHNYSYIKSEHPSRVGSNVYGMDRTGSFALCTMARPFSNLDANDDSLDWEEYVYEPRNYFVGYKVFDDSDNLVASEFYLLEIEGACLSFVVATTLVLTSIMIF